MVSDSLGCWSSVLPAAQSGVPPNVVASVSPGPRLKAVMVCLHRGCTSSGRGIWENGYIHDIAIDDH